MSQIGTNKDIPILITVKDVDGNPVDIDIFDSDIEVGIYQKKENIIQLFKESEGEVEIVDADLGQIRIRIDRINTDKINTLNPLYIEVVPYSVDDDYEGGVRKWDVPVVKLPDVKFSAI